MELRTCKVCGLEKEAIQGVWVTWCGKPMGRTCLSCYVAKQQAKRATEDGRAKANAYANKSSSRLVTSPKTGHLISAGALASAKSQSRLVISPKTGSLIRAGSVAITKHFEQSTWHKLKKQLTKETKRILKDLAVGRSTDYRCRKLFGASREEVYAHIDAQLQKRGFSWKNHGDEWVLDHRTPLAMAQSSIELYQLCLLENTQVLTPAENDAKRLEDIKLIREFEAQLV